MKHSIRTNTLAAVIGITLVSAAWHVPAQAGRVNAAAQASSAITATSAAAENNGVEPYIIEFVESGLVNYNGSVAGISATSPSATQSKKLDTKSDAARAYDAYLASQRAIHVGEIQQTLARALDVTHSYAITLNGVAADMSAAEAAKVAQLSGVKSIRPAGVEYLDTYRGPAFIGADVIWNGTATPDSVGTLGEGMKVGVLDGGANSAHPSFANNTSCGFSTALPKLIARDCSASSAGVCNGPQPDAVSGAGGHGVHTASTVAGNTLDNMDSPAPALPDGMVMSGVAPCAQVFQYKVCPGSTCGGAAILAGIQNAISDQVDVMNFSISGGTSPWSDNDRGFLDAVNADVFVAASAGNNTTADPTVISRVNHRGPWVMTVAASTQDEIVGPSLSATGPGTPPVEVTNIPLNPGSTTSITPTLSSSPVKADPANILGCTDDGAFPAGYFTGSIAVVQRGICPFTEKIANAHAAGAVAVVVANNQVGSINMDTAGAPSVPAYSIIQSQGDALLAFIAANGTSATADLVPIGEGITQPDVIADFSYRGPTPGNLADLTKPDITAPGVNIYAATDPASGQYEFMSGTSMSGPHVAGAATLMRAVHPDWTVTEIKSAMQSTARSAGFMEDGVTPWTIDVVGSGVVDLSKAALAGLTLDETYARFLAANPAGGSINIKELNLPSVRNMNCTPDCTFTRTVTNKLDTNATWSTSFQSEVGDIMASVSPATFTLAPGATQVLTITAGPPYETAMTAIGFGNLLFTEANGLSPIQHFSVALKGTGGEEPVDENDVIFADGFDGEGGEVGLPVVMVLDDGTAEGAIAWTDNANVKQYPSIWLNRFSPSADQFPMTLDNVQILWPSSSGGDPVGKDVLVLVYVDVDGDGDPSNAVLVGQSAVSIGSVDTFETYAVNIALPDAGDVYLGFEDVFAEGGTSPILYVSALDTDSTTNRAWIAAGDEVSPNINDLGANDYLETIEDVSGGSITGNWMIRGNGTTTSGRPVQLD